MKKLFYLSLALGLFSCSSSDNTIEDNSPPPPVIQTEKAYVYCADGVGTINPKEYYEFTYENGNLTNVKGRFLPVFFQMFNMFFSNLITTLSYDNNKIKVSALEFDSTMKHDEYLYYMENGRPAKVEYYYVYQTGNSPIVYTKTYTYEQDKVKKIVIKFNNAANTEYATTYYYDNNNNLTKSEMFETGNGVTYQQTTNTYSDFDNAANPFKKLYLINDVFYEKSLSANNFRIKESVVERLNPNSGIPPKTSKKIWTYKYDVNGQVSIYYPYP